MYKCVKLCYNKRVKRGNAFIALYTIESEVFNMKVMIDGYEVEIKAKSEFSNRFNKEDTLSLLNTINIWQYSEAEISENKYKETGKECHKRVSELRYKKCAKLHDFLASFGIYDEFN